MIKIMMPVDLWKEIIQYKSRYTSDIYWINMNNFLKEKGEKSGRWKINIHEWKVEK